MRSLFTKFCISNALDSGKTLSPKLQRKIESDAELRAFAESVSRLDRGLTPPETAELPPFSHQAIMRAVKSAQADSEPEGVTPFRLKWLPVAGCAVLLLAGVWWFARRAPSPAPELASVESAPAAIGAGDPVAQDLTATVVAPLSEEWHRLSLDWDKTAEFLLANLP
jgi:hypothetical protein